MSKYILNYLGVFHPDPLTWGGGISNLGGADD